MGPVGQFCHLEKFPYPLIQDTVVNIYQFPIKFKVVICGEFDVKRTILRADPDNAPDLFRVSDNVVGIDACSAACRPQQGSKDPDKSALTRTVWA
jgi:hypothetical protein